MTLSELLHKRILVVVKGSAWESQKVEELKVLEISPSGKWLKVQNLNGAKFWKSVSDIQVVEVLHHLDTDNPGRNTIAI